VKLLTDNVKKDGDKRIIIIEEKIEGKIEGKIEEKIENVGRREKDGNTTLDQDQDRIPPLLIQAKIKN
jgi:hypothetical protein